MGSKKGVSAPAPSKRSRPGGRAAEVVAAVHSATLELLQERGYEQLEIPDIAQHAQVNKTTIYRRWPSKAELVLDAALAKIRLDVPLPDTGTLLGDLTAFLQSIVTILATPFAGGLLRAMISRGENESGFEQARAQFWNERFSIIGKLVERGVERGEIAAATPPREFLEMAVAPFFYRLLVTGDKIRKGDIEAIARRTVAAFQNN